MIHPMLAKKANEIPRAPGYVIEPKLDGWRWLIERGADGEFRFYSGRNSKQFRKDLKPLSRIVEVLDFLPPGTILDSELMGYKNGFDSSGGDSVIGSVLAQTPRGRGGWLEVFAFDVLRVNDVPTLTLPWESRRSLLEKMAEGFDEAYVKLVPYVDDTPEEMQRVHDEWVAAGVEGSVAKRKKSLYRPGSRSNDWPKIKPQDTMEAVVIGYEMGRGKSNQDQVSSLEIRLLETGYETSCAKNATVPEAKAMIGRTLEVLHHGVGSSGSVRHPVFKRWRPDRDTNKEMAA